ncbi:MAG: extracellular solute-binding protein [Ahrensia sp.]|nr:extracellular solute-binding protein [Ahrensia sp.]
MMMRAALATLLATTALLGAPAAALAAGEVNLYTSRHYDTDERLYSGFEAATGIKINRIEGEADELLERIKTEGANSPADVFMTVDAGRVWRAQEAGIFSPVESPILEERIPEALQHPDNLWFGFSTRARLIFFSKDRVSNPPQTYAALADPQYKGKICTRSGSNIYSLSLLASQIKHNGEEAATNWAKGIVANFAREPKGGDTDQLKAIISGECDIVVANHYYFARGLAGGVEGLSAEIGKIGWVFPDQDGNGTHINTSAAGVLKTAPNRENAIKLLQYLSSDLAQEYFANGNNEYPAVAGASESAIAKKPWRI